MHVEFFISIYKLKTLWYSPLSMNIFKIFITLMTSLSCVLTFASSEKPVYPWEAISLSIEQSVVAGEDIPLALKRIAPEYMQSLNRESEYEEFKILWGLSINFDEIAKSEILPSPLIDALGTLFKVAPRNGRIVHAGLEHTYGYLLSTLQTKYGYKRDRWVKPDIEEGFGLNRDELSPFPQSGSFFSNITYFAGTVAFRTDTEALEVLTKSSHYQAISPSLKEFDFRKLRPSRLTETIILNNERRVEIRTDFIPFLYKNKTSTNDALMIYSVKDSTHPLPYLVTLFPISLSTMLPAESSLGDHQPIVTRWNAFIPGVTDANSPLFGTRTLQLKQ